MKANPYQPLLRHMVGVVDGIDIASGGELRMALDAGAAPEKISFAGPGKRDDELREAIKAGVTINIESPGECDRALQIGKAEGQTPRLAIRVNPDFDLKGSGMKMAQTLDLAARLATSIGRSPGHVNLGGGFGIPYFPGEEPLDIARVGQALSEKLAQLPEILSKTQFAIELGRYLVGEAGVYLTRIVDRKQSLSGDRWRAASSACGQWQFRDGRQAQLSCRNRQPVRCRTR